MRASWMLCGLLVFGLLPQMAQAQGGPPAAVPRGPADLINKAREARPQADMARRAPAPSSRQGHDSMFRAPSPAASARPDPNVPVGTIVVEVRRSGGQVAAAQEVSLGVMGNLGQRSTKEAKTDIAGVASFGDLATGSKQAYRVNVSYQGAKFSSTPFRLDERSGYRVRLGMLPVSRDKRMVFQMIGQTMVELKDDRLHITQQSRMTNAGGSVYVFPKEGEALELPEGFMSFQTQKVMTDQRLEEDPDKGARIFGSLPPGTVTLTWSYDLPRDGASARIPVDVPFRTYQYRIIADAPEGMEFSASEFPEAQKLRDRGRQLWITQLQRAAEEPRISGFTIRLDGIPGPGPGRWIAVALAALALLLGLFAAVKPGAAEADRPALLQSRREALLADALSTEKQHADGDIGPQYRGRRMDQIVTALAAVLRDQESLEAGAAKANKK